MKLHRWIVRGMLSALLWMGVSALGHAATDAPDGFIDWHAAIVGTPQDAPAPSIIVSPNACPGCCSSHGGISNQCASNGNIRCNDGTTSPTCRCSSCGVSQTPTCSGGQTWNGSACVCPSGQVLTNGVCRTPPPTCTGGQTWNGTACVCPNGQVLTNGVCRTPPPTCTGGRVWNGTSCVCPTGQTFTNGQCVVAPPTCTGGQIWNGSACSCPANQVLTNGQCRVAPAFVIGSGISGNWYNAAQNGHGFQFEVLKSAPNIVTVFWFTFDNAGNQVWISGAGTIDGNRLVVQALRQMNGRFPPYFDSAALDQLSWGTLTFTFADCMHARVDWTSVDPAFSANGNMQIEQLTQVAGTSCP